MPASYPVATLFRHPLGDGLLSPEHDGDGYYVALAFDRPNPDIGASYHLGADWNGESGGDNDQGEPVYAVSNGTVVAAVSDQGTSTSGFGNYVVIRHELPEPTWINGSLVDHVNSLYAHLDSVTSVAVGSIVGIGQQIGTLGKSGNAEVAHLHFEITLGDVLPTSDDGYNPSGAPRSWIDPVTFIDERMASGPPAFSEVDAVKMGTFLSRASYGGSAIAEDYQGTWRGDADPFNYDDDYRGYLGSQSYSNYTWFLLAESELGSSFFSGPTGGNFTAGGLFRSTAGLGESNFGEALLAHTSLLGGESALVLAFRGSDGFDAFGQGQTYTAAGLASYYSGMRPIIEAAAAYADRYEIDNIVVAGHSLGGTLADLFALADANLFDGRNLQVVSLASAGVDPVIYEHRGALDLDLSNSYAPDGVLRSIGLPDGVTYTGIAHSQDRVSFDIEQWLSTDLSPNLWLEENLHFSFDTTIDLPNISNVEVSYNKFFDHGFGAEHNEELYWANVSGLLSDPLYRLFDGHRITVGLTDYSQVPDIGGATLPLFQSYTGLANSQYFDDDGSRLLLGSSQRDYMLGLEGDDRLVGDGEDDLLSGGNGDDILGGRDGGDVLAGGSGRDILTGGKNGDVFVFTTADFPRNQSFIPDTIADFNQGDLGVPSPGEGDLIDLSGVDFSTSTGFGGVSTVRLRSVETSGGLPAGALLEVMTEADIWWAVARLDGVVTGQSVNVALTEAQSVNRIGTAFVVDAVRTGVTWTITPASPTVTEGGAITFTITRSDDTTEQTVYISTTVNRGSHNEDDYTYWLNVPRTFQVGQLSREVTVQTIDDSEAEGTQTFGLIVQASPSDPASVYLQGGISSFTILDDDTPATPGPGISWTSTDEDHYFYGTSGNDTANGVSGSNTLLGNGGDDYLAVSGGGTNHLSGGSGNDSLQAVGGTNTLLGGGGDDYIGVGGAGSYVIDGGAGVDRLDFNRSDLTTAMTVGLAAGVNGSSYAFTLSDGTSVGNVELLGLQTGSGDDRVTFNTTVAGSQNWNAGEGIDTAIFDFSAFSDGVINRYWSGDSYRASADSYSIFYNSVEKLTIYGGAGADNLAGISGGSNTLHGNDGDDYLAVSGGGTNHLSGGSGNDSLQAVGGTNTLLGGGGDDYIGVGGAGSYVIDGGAGVDRLDFNRSDLTTAMTVGLAAGVNGSSYAFTLSDGTSVGNVELLGLQTGSGDDRVTFNTTVAGTQSWYANAGNDTAIFDYSAFSDGVGVGTNYYGYVVQNVSLYGVENLTIRGGAGNDSLQGISGGENTLYGNGGDDSLSVYGGGANFLSGGSGNDSLQAVGGTNTLLGGSGDDTLTAGTGNDTLDGGADVDTMTGGDGNDTFFVDNPGDQVIEATGGGSDTVYARANFALGAGQEVEYLRVSGAAGLVLTGNGLANYLIGGVGGDALNGDAGKDKLDGKTGADVLSGGAGDDTYYVDQAGDQVIEAVGGGIDNVYASATFMLGAGQEVEYLRVFGPSGLTLTGNELANYLIGGAGGDTLAGGAGNDKLDGGLGADNLAGGVGDDIYYVGQAGDQVIEAVGGGIDNVYASATFMLGAGQEVEYLRVSGTAGLSLMGNELANYLIGGTGSDTLGGGDGNDKLNGGAGADILGGGTGNDIYYIDTAGDRVIEAVGEGSDTVYATANFALGAGQEVEYLRVSGAAGLSLTGNELSNVLVGGAGDDKLDGGAGTDSMRGGSGDDVFYVDGAGDQVIEAAGGGTDNIYASANFTLGAGQEVEYVRVSGAAGLSLTGNEFANYLIGGTGGDTLGGGAGDDKLDGRAGTDTMAGGSGNDTYYVDDAGDQVIEAAGGGTDTVFASANFVLGAGQEVDYLRVSSTAGLSLAGNEFANYLIGATGVDTLGGGAGDDKLDGRAGADTMAGGSGNDTYYVDDAGDQVIEAVSGGSSDTVFASANFALGAGQEVEYLRVSGAAGLTLTGNELANSLVGGAGNDRLTGSGGLDRLTGGMGNDTFVFDQAPVGANVAKILDFAHGVDMISLSLSVFSAAGAAGALNANAFFIGTAAHDADDRIIYNSTTGALMYDADGAGGQAARSFATASLGLTLMASDFLLA
ncbi:peptidoglycan DD-metalloendopeptidase family protein [Reyranella sp.]|uniref:peptidoglycan DD-metalloendopeptidase family protein n=1 Tax=Reyranella sp. TaxID=1929291 RepID=UPI003F72C28D